jgi:hypothetical protein
MIAALRLPSRTEHGYAIDPDSRVPHAARLSAPDGSWCEIALSSRGDLPSLVREAGPTALWALVEDAYRTWLLPDSPGGSGWG